VTQHIRDIMLLK